MTPKQQAEELISKYKNNVYRKAFSDSDEYKDRWYIIDNETAKQCALIAVIEILTIFYDDTKDMWLDEIEYWHDVKNEIEAL